MLCCNPLRGTHGITRSCSGSRHRTTLVRNRRPQRGDLFSPNGMTTMAELMFIPIQKDRVPLDQKMGGKSVCLGRGL